MTFAKLPYYIVVKVVEVKYPDVIGYEERWLSFPGVWTERQPEAMRFPSRVLAESHAKRYRGEVKEVRP